VDLALANDSVGYAVSIQHANANINSASKPTATDVYSMGLPRKSTAVELLPQIKEILIELKREGAFDALMKAPSAGLHRRGS
jgi:hypothetical protein